MKLAILLLIAVVSLGSQETTHKTQPKLIRKVEPQYTDEARAARLQGTVVLSLTIDAEGVPADIKVAPTRDGAGRKSCRMFTAMEIQTCY
ncbi:MAG TPA: TonB family protein [Bryobacteraceae bacterium]|jgi:hypothetical protein|nr:TonB family protein [Bryobacteraceae bacterium]